MDEKNYIILNMQKKIKLIRQVFDVNIMTFAEMIGVTRQTIYNIENGKTILTKTQFLAICQVLNLLLEIMPEKRDIVRSIWESDYKTSDVDLESLNSERER